MVNSTTRAPKTISRIFTAITIPLKVDARIQFIGILQTSTPSSKAITKAIGMAFDAGHRKPTIRIKIAAIGITASRASTPSDMMVSLLSKKISIKIAKSSKNRNIRGQKIFDFTDC
jgi:hypothetical protein